MNSKKPESEISKRIKKIFKEIGYLQRMIDEFRYLNLASCHDSLRFFPIVCELIKIYILKNTNKKISRDIELFKHRYLYQSKS